MTHQYETFGLDIIRRGGQEAVDFFLKVGRERYQTGGETALENWVTKSSPYISEDDRIGLLSLLMKTVFDTSPFQTGHFNVRARQPLQ